MKQSLKLNADEWVEVRSKEEILATLDEKGQLDKLPFMSEMFQFCGQRLKVYKRAHKTCDTVNKTGGVRMSNAVHLEGIRCNGAGHDGCQARCLIFWKEAWLKRPGASEDDGRNASETKPEVSGKGMGCTEAQLKAASRIEDGVNNNPTYVCQATQVPAATTPLRWWDVRQYIEDYSSGNEGLGRLLCGFIYSVYNHLINSRLRLGKTLRWWYDKTQKLRGGFPYPRKWGAIPVGDPTPSTELNLQPGEWVRVKSFDAILATLNEANKNRGMYFDAEEVPHCGGIFKVIGRINKIIDEKTGKMISFKSESVMLEGTYCQSRYSEKRMFCPRSIPPFWREIWLERVPMEELTGGESNSNSGVALGGASKGEPSCGLGR